MYTRRGRWLGARGRACGSEGLAECQHWGCLPRGGQELHTGASHLSRILSVLQHAPLGKAEPLPSRFPELEVLQHYLLSSTATWRRGRDDLVRWGEPGFEGLLPLGAVPPREV